MSSDERMQSSGADQSALGDLLRARVGDSGKATTAPRNPNCTECGSRLTENSEFCWMCGATRGVHPASVVQPTSVVPQPAAVESVVRMFPPPTYAAPPAERQQEVTSTVGMYSKAATAAEPVFERAAPGPQPVVEPELFRHFYQPEPEDAEADQDEQQRRRFDYRLAVLAALLIVLGVIGYRQRNNAKAVYALLSQEIQQLLEPTAQTVAEQKSLPQRAANPSRARAKSARRSVPTRVPQTATAEEYIRVQTRATPFLGVRVQGQPGPELISYAPHSTPPSFLGDAPTVVPQFLTSSPPAPFAVTISPRESLSLLLRQVRPNYPPDARAAGARGPVVLKAIIRKDGNVGALSVISGHPLLRQAAIDAVRQWVYRPYYRGADPTDVETLVVVDFPAGDRAATAGKQHPGD